MKVTAIKQQVKRKDRYSFYIDDSYAFSLSETALLESRLSVGQELEPADVRAYKQLSADDKVQANALRYVAMRPRSIGEMRDYLRRKQANEPVAAKIIDRFIDIGLLNDESFARLWVENRRVLKPTARRKLRIELQSKKIAPQLIDQVLAEDREQLDEREVLRSVVAKKQARYPDRTKFMQYLARQGYSYDDIKSVLSEADL